MIATVDRHTVVVFTLNTNPINPRNPYHHPNPNPDEMQTMGLGALQKEGANSKKRQS